MEQSERNDGGPAFPQPFGPHGAEGLTVRDCFAAVALSGYLSQEMAETDRKEIVADELYDWADAMIAARSK